MSREDQNTVVNYFWNDNLKSLGWSRRKIRNQIFGNKMWKQIGIDGLLKMFKLIGKYKPNYFAELIGEYIMYMNASMTSCMDFDISDDTIEDIESEYFDTIDDTIEEMSDDMDMETFVDEYDLTDWRLVEINGEYQYRYFEGIDDAERHREWFESQDDGYLKKYYDALDWKPREDMYYGYYDDEHC